MEYAYKRVQRVIPTNSVQDSDIICSSIYTQRHSRVKLEMEGGIQLVPYHPEKLAQELRTHNSTVVLVDIRPAGHYNCSHIKNAENLNFSNILLRRLLKGVVKLESMLSSTELAEKLCSPGSRTRLVLYDGSSNAASKKQDLLKHAEVLYSATEESDDSDDDIERDGPCIQRSGQSSGRRLVHFLDGGFVAFSSQFPILCEQSTADSLKQSSPPLCVSVSASLPISFQGSNFRPKLKLPTPLHEDDSDSFGPPVEILPHLVLGCAKDSANLITLRRMGITAILNVSHNCTNHFETLFEYKTIRVEDSYQADLLSRLQDAFSFIDDIKSKGGKVLVHCHAGISRSATVSIAYIMKQQGWDLPCAYDFVKQRRPCVSPNLHFMGQLLEFQRQLTEGRLHHVASSQCSSDDTESHKNTSRATSGISVIAIESTAVTGTASAPGADDSKKYNTQSISAPSSLYLFKSSGAGCRYHPSASLPNSPIALFNGRPPNCAHEFRSRNLQSLQLSPCRVVAQRMEPCLSKCCLSCTNSL